MRIAIVGGGPAGLVAALYLSTLRGAEIVIHEKQQKPVYSASLCAEGVSLAILSRLEKDTSFDSSPYISRRVRGIRVVFPNGKDGYIAQEGATLDRTAWQQGMAAFLEKKDVLFNWGSAITDPARTDCEILIGADGPASKIRSAIGGRADMVPAVQYRMRMDRPGDFLEFFTGEMFYSGSHNDGYGWIFPKRDCFNVGVKGNFPALDRFLEAFDIKGEILEKAGAPIAVNGTVWEKTQSGMKIFLTGDAAGLTNPVTCGGLSPAIACAGFIRQAVIRGEAGTYTSLIRRHGYDPAYWNRVHALFYPRQQILNQIGEILNGARANPPSPAAMLRMFLHPAAGKHCLVMLPSLRRLKNVSW